MPDLKIYFDYVCPYCWIADVNISRFTQKFPNIIFDWKPWEIVPETPADGLPLGFSSVSKDLSRLAEEAGLWMRVPSIQPNSRLAFLGLFYAKEQGKAKDYHDAVFRALWLNDENIGKLDTLSNIIEEIGLDAAEFRRCLRNERRRYELMLEASEQDADDDNISLVPTFVFGEKQVIGNVSSGRIERFIRQVSGSAKAEADKCANTKAQ